MANPKNTTKDILIADRYSDALVELAKDGKLTYGQISDDLNLIKSTLVTSRDLNEFLVNPLISLDDKKIIIDKVFLGEINDLMLNFLKVLVDKSRFGAFDSVVDSYNKAIDNINNISRVTVVSAVQMTDEAQSKLKNKLETKMKKNVVLNLEISSDIIAGLVIKIGDNIVDMSLKHKLEDLSKSIMR